jgi:hypothetical protein
MEDYKEQVENSILMLNDYIKELWGEIEKAQSMTQSEIKKEFEVDNYDALNKRNRDRIQFYNKCLDDEFKELGKIYSGVYKVA